MIFGTITELGISLADLVEDQAEWSRATFGSDKDRGPIGALKHLAKEAVEAQHAFVIFEMSQTNPQDEIDPVQAKADLKNELADCLLLILDASRRSGVKVMQLIEAAQEKMKVNKSRTWPKPTSDEPVEHVK